MKKNSVWHKDIFANARSKTIFLIIFGIVLVGLAILVWANQAGKISLWAATTQDNTINLKAQTNCLAGGQSRTNALSFFNPKGYRQVTIQRKVEGCNTSDCWGALENQVLSSTVCPKMNQINSGFCNISGCNCVYLDDGTNSVGSLSRPDPSVNYKYRVYFGDWDAGASPIRSNEATAYKCSGTEDSGCGTHAVGDRWCDGTTANYCAGHDLIQADYCDCATGYTPSCSSGVCGCTPVSTPPVAECSAGEYKCVGNVAYSCSGDGSGTWTTSECPSPTTCQMVNGVSQCVFQCSDTDGGNVPAVAGTVTIEGNPNTYADKCNADGTQLQEYYCDTGGALGEQIYSGSCINGALVDYTIPVMQPITSSCVSDDSDEQTNVLNWTGQLASGSVFMPMIKSPETEDPTDSRQNGFVHIPEPDNPPFGVASTEDSTYTHQYKSMNDVQYAVIIDGYIDSFSNAETAENKDCGSSTPTYTATQPTDPTNLYAEPVDKDTVKLTWDKSDNAGYYEIYNPDSSTPIIRLLATDADVQTYTMNGLKCGTEYSYYVIAVNGNLESGKSNTATTTTSECGASTSGIEDEKVDGLVIENDNDMISLSWNALDSASGYDIYDCDGNFLVSTDQTSYLFTGLECDKDYCFYVVGHDENGGESQSSDQASIKTNCGGDEEPVAISGVTALVSTGASLWFNILLALVITACVAYFIFRRDIHDKK